MEVNDDSFSAKMEDLKGNVSVVEFDSEVVDSEDRPLIENGARLTYSVYRRDQRTGRTYGSKLAINRKISWSLQDEEKAHQLIKDCFPDSLLD